MTLTEALEVLARHRGRRIVIPTMASVGEWPRWSDTPLDFAYMPSSMGQGPALGLGLALAQPERGVIVINGDGSMLMNLGVLVTIAQHPCPLFLIIVDNGIYEVTGGQEHVGARRVDYAGLARAAGISRTYHFADAATWAAGAAEALADPGPVVIWWSVEPRFGQRTPKPPRPMAEQIDRLAVALSMPVA